MAAADFFFRGKKRFDIAYFNHGTPQADSMEEAVFHWASENSVAYQVGDISSTTKPKDLSPEEHWRNERYNWLQEVADGRPIVTCHHLDDVAETWIFSSLHGNPKIIAPIASNNNPASSKILRPFLTTTKQDMIDWCVSHDVTWFEDASNKDVTTPRNRIRHNIMKEALAINPGLHKVMKKKVLSLFEENNSTL
jgi:tRNA(Ile)-lysidine synthase